MFHTGHVLLVILSVLHSHATAQLLHCVVLHRIRFRAPVRKGSAEQEFGWGRMHDSYELERTASAAEPDVSPDAFPLALSKTSHELLSENSAFVAA